MIKPIIGIEDLLERFLSIPVICRNSDSFLSKFRGFFPDFQRHFNADCMRRVNNLHKFIALVSMIKSGPE